MDVLTYENFRSQIRDGDLIGFAGDANWLPFCGGSFESWLIRWWTNTEGKWRPWALSEISHPGIAVWVEIAGERSLWIAEQVGFGVILSRMSWRLSTYPGKIYHRSYIAQDCQRRAVVDKAVSLQGEKYSPLYQFAFTGCKPLQQLCHRFGWNTDTAKNGRVCSEFAAECYEAGGTSCGKIPAEVTPIDLWQQRFFGYPTHVVLEH